MRGGHQYSAKPIQDADAALSANGIGDKVKTNDQWIKSSQSVMTEIIENKCTKVQQFREKLRFLQKNTVYANLHSTTNGGQALTKPVPKIRKPQIDPV